MHPARTEAPAPAAAQPGVMGRVQAYVGLTKPRIIELLLVTTFPAMFLAAGGFPPLGLAVITFVGGTLSAASANVFNSVLDADIDEQMRRTRRRPMVREQVSKRAAYTFGVVLGIISTLMLGLGANWLAAALSVTAILYYVFIYTVWLKRRTAQNIVWGGVAGCFPPLIGWTAVTGSVAWPPIILFLIVFFWTPPHTWALGLRYREDYASVDVPMLPVVKDAPHVAWQILVYSVLTVVTSLALWPCVETGSSRSSTTSLPACSKVWGAPRSVPESAESGIVPGGCRRSRRSGAAACGRRGEVCPGYPSLFSFVGKG